MPEWDVVRVDRVGTQNWKTHFKIDKQGIVHMTYAGCSKIKDDICQNSELFYGKRDLSPKSKIYDCAEVFVSAVNRIIPFWQTSFLLIVALGFW